MNRPLSTSRFFTRETASNYWNLFPRSSVRRALIGIVRICSSKPVQELGRALAELEILSRGCHAVLVENYGWGRRGASLEGKVRDHMTLLLRELSKVATVPLGLSLSPNHVETAFEIAAQCNLRLIRLAYVTGRFSNGPAVFPPDLTRLREAHPSITVLGGVNPRDYCSDEEISFSMTCPCAMSFSDAVIITQGSSEYETQCWLRTARQGLGAHPLLVESGVTADNAVGLLRSANGIIVGRYFRKISGELDETCVRSLAARLQSMSW